MIEAQIASRFLQVPSSHTHANFLVLKVQHTDICKPFLSYSFISKFNLNLLLSPLLGVFQGFLCLCEGCVFFVSDANSC